MLTILSLLAACPGAQLLQHQVHTGEGADPQLQLRDTDRQALADLSLPVVRREAESKKRTTSKRGKKPNGNKLKQNKRKGRKASKKWENNNNKRATKKKRNKATRRNTKKKGRKQRKGSKGKKKNGKRIRKQNMKGKRSKKKKRGKKGGKKDSSRRKLKKKQRQSSNCSVLSCLNEMVFSLKIEKDTVRNFLAQEKRVNAKTNLMSMTTRLRLILLHIKMFRKQTI